MADRDALLARVQEFIRHDVDPADREELGALVASRNYDELASRFSGPLVFGTAGIRGVLGAGESRINRSVVVRVTHGLVRYLVDAVPDAAARGIAIARDGRHRSDVFQKDAAAVAAALGMRIHWLEGPSPTPFLAFAVKHLHAAAGIVITASHNPPQYNGYKAYWDNGAQIVPPLDTGIAAMVDAAPPADEIPRDDSSELIEEVDVASDYVDAVCGLSLAPDVDVSPLRVAYSALHGVGQRPLLEVLERRGFRHIFPVPEQATPNGDFPTVRFPNPEEPGALDRALAVARANDCVLVLANDPDADRLGAVVRSGDGSYVPLTGNEIGALLASYILEHTKETKPLVVSTIVSSRMVETMCREAGARYEDTLTGFKWIANEAMRIEREEGCRFVFGFEEALGYTVGTVVRDKDGISAGLLLAEKAAGLAANGKTLLDELYRLRQRYGFFVSRQKSITLEGAEGAAAIDGAMRALREHAPSRLGSERLERSERDGVLLYDLESGGRVAVRPSGTEPKLKFYMEVVAGEQREPSESRTNADARLDAIQADILRAAGFA